MVDHMWVDLEMDLSMDMECILGIRGNNTRDIGLRGCRMVKGK